LQRLTSEEAPPKRLRPLATSPTICCPIHLRGPRHLAQPACPIRLRSQPTTRPIASPSPYSTGTHGATCSRGRICHTHACSPARARAPAAPPSPRRRPGRPRGCGRTRPASQSKIRVLPPPLGRPRERRGDRIRSISPTIRRLAKGTIDLVRWRAPVQLLKYATRTVFGSKMLITGYPVVLYTKY
jgi:hypothetical protein